MTRGDKSTGTQSTKKHCEPDSRSDESKATRQDNHWDRGSRPVEAQADLHGRQHNHRQFFYKRASTLHASAATAADGSRRYRAANTRGACRQQPDRVELRIIDDESDLGNPRRLARDEMCDDRTKACGALKVQHVKANVRHVSYRSGQLRRVAISDDDKAELAHKEGLHDGRNPPAFTW